MINIKNDKPMKHPENLEYYENTNSINNRTRGRRKNPDQRRGKYFQQNHRKKFP